MVLVSRDAREYRKRVDEACIEQRVPTDRLGGSLEVNLIAHPPDRRRRDIDNLIKPLLDSLMYAQVIADDVHVDRLSIERACRIPAGRIAVEVRHTRADARQERPGQPRDLSRQA